ncbi:MAG: NHL repeat-containing protein [Desulfobulbaceae bacterium]|nr:NHL repeat-containing protein [Desulfobulbaceae bacterium]HIJ78269.1 hypothetical protein [Deltaproteobacteria bacterium]
MPNSDQQQTATATITPRPRKAPRWYGLLILALTFLPVPSLHNPWPAQAAENEPGQQMVSIATILTQDMEGKPLRFPSAVAFDKDQEELYLISNSKDGIIVYDNDFFPYIALGKGRGITAPTGIFFDGQSGDIYICQDLAPPKPPRLTIVNSAFFLRKEITFKQMPDGGNFSPKCGTIGKNGNIYLAGNNTKGVLVLDKDGNYLRWLKPLDLVRAPTAKTDETAQEPNGLTEVSQNELNLTEPSPEAKEADEGFGLPENLRPKSSSMAPPRKDGREMAPVQIVNVTSDQDGHLFLLSEDTSKVYVYSPSETLLFSFGEKGGSGGKMSRPRGIAVDDNKKCIYVVDYMRQTILVFDMGGKFIFEFGGRGTGPLWFNFPTSVTTDRLGRIIVSDLFNHRIQIMKPSFDMSFPLFYDANKAENKLKEETEGSPEEIGPAPQDDSSIFFKDND